MQERHNTAPDAAQTQTIEPQRLRDRACFGGHPERSLLARLLTAADLDGLDQIDCSLADIPPGYEHAIVIGADACGRRQGPVAVPKADAVRLDAMSDGEILAHLGRGARYFFRFVRDDRIVYLAAEQFARRRRPDWPATLRNAPCNRAERIAKLDILRRRCSTGGGHAG